MRDSFLFNRNIWEAIKKIPDEDKMETLRVIIEYGLDGTSVDSKSNIANAILIVSKQYIDRGNHFLDGQNGRHSSEYQAWRRAVFERDNYTCQYCGVRGAKLNAHHMKEYSKYPQLRYDIDNGITLCKKCHKEVHKREK